MYLLLSLCYCFVSFLYLDLYVLGDDALIGWGSFVPTRHLCVLVRVWAGGGVVAPLGRCGPFSEYFTGCARAVLLLWIIYVILSCLLCFHERLVVDALWSPAGKGLASWTSFVMSNCDVVTFGPLVSWVRCGA